ncbi:MAG: cellulase family glycosylhydrolase [Rhodospirillales bacterium]|nr:cellulase family glycosylhydrolase [Rhodospirillales bacterium]
MRRAWMIVRCLLAVFVLLASWQVGGARAEVPAERLAMLQRGVALTGWFRFPASHDPAALGTWIADGALASLRRVGFGFVRLPVDPGLLTEPGIPAALEEAIRRLHRHGFAVVVSLHPIDWHLETSAADRAALRTAWNRLAPVLRRAGARSSVAELLNEPVFPGDPAGWQALQHELLRTVRAVLPDHTIVLTGPDWSSVDGLLAMTPEPDANVVYTVHLYTPAELTALAPWRPALDRTALARLPFPTTKASRCEDLAAATDAETAGVIRFYCAQHWDAARVAAMLDRAAAWGRRHRVPLLLGEFGATARLMPSARFAWIRAVRETAERAGMGWALWGYDDVMGLAVDRAALRRPGPGPPLDPRLLDALGLPAPN